jgi:hypothetical protein
MEHSQYRHIASQARIGADAMVVPVRGHDQVGCLSDQVKLTRALNENVTLELGIQSRASSRDGC